MGIIIKYETNISWYFRMLVIAISSNYNQP